jgi:branched-chain amino acid transport system substrate-binding protein
MRRAFIILALFAVCAFGQQAIKVGFIAPLTGPAAADGFSALQSALLAVDYINAHGGINGVPLELVYYDDALSPDQAAALTRKLIEGDKVVAVVSGSYSSTSRAAAAVCQELKVPFVAAYAVHPSIVQVGEYAFRVGMAAQIQGRIGGYFAVRELGAKRIALLIMNNDFGISLAQAFKEAATSLGATIVYEKRYPVGETEFRDYLTAIKAADPDLLYAPGYYNEAANITRQFRELGLRCWLMGDEGYDSPKYLELAGPAANGVFITTDLDRDSRRPITQFFLKAYEERTGIPADMVGASAFDAVMIVAHVLRQAGADPKAFIAYLAELKNFEDAATGPILMFQERTAVRPMQIQIVLNGKFRHFYEYGPEEPIIYYTYP